jgi:hypothetical protein
MYEATQQRINDKSSDVDTKLALGLGFIAKTSEICCKHASPQSQHPIQYDVKKKSRPIGSNESPQYLSNSNQIDTQHANAVQLLTLMIDSVEKYNYDIYK